MLGLTPSQCAEVFAAGDLSYYQSAGCVNTQSNDALLASKKGELNTKTMLIIGGGLIGAGIIIYLSLKK